MYFYNLRWLYLLKTLYLFLLSRCHKLNLCPTHESVPSLVTPSAPLDLGLRKITDTPCFSLNS